MRTFKYVIHEVTLKIYEVVAESEVKARSDILLGKVAPKLVIPNDHQHWFVQVKSKSSGAWSTVYGGAYQQFRAAHKD